MKNRKAISSAARFVTPCCLSGRCASRVTVARDAVARLDCRALPRAVHVRATGHRDHPFRGIVITQNGAS